MKTLVMFPGQGAQKVGMGAELLSDFATARHTFEEAEDTLHLPIKRLCLEGPQADLELTTHQQPCLLTLCTAIWRVLSAESAVPTHDFYAGHSLGEYSALVASERLDFATALSLVHQRGQAMQAAVPAGMGGMAAVMGPKASTLEDLCQQVSAAQNATLEVVNFNTPEQHIISGHTQALKAACDQLAAAGVRTIPLAVSAPFHSSLMQPARLAMTPALTAASLHAGRGQMLANRSGDLADPYPIHLLIEQIDQPVRWCQSLLTAHDHGVVRYVEVGPSKVLCGLAKRSLPKGHQILSAEKVTAAIAALN